ncbi:MAG: IPTL-CTERM sorting domain-containing protein, partial [Acidobacteriota bacterium]
GNLTFTDTFPANLVVASPPNVVNGCGGTVTANAGAGSVSLAAGTVAGLSTCTVSVEVTTAVDGVYDNVVELTSDAGSSGNATATLNAIARPMFAKAFLSAPVLRGGAVTLEYTITNPSNQALTDVAFNDDIGAVFPGLAAEGLPTADVCGAGSQVAGTAVVSLTGGSLAPGASCTFGVTVRVPTDAPLGSIQSVSGPVTAVVLGESISGNSALAELEVAFLEITKAFLATTVVGGAVTGLEFTITNPDPVNTATAVTFTDDLDAALPGLAAIDLPQVGVCGAGSQADGTSVITLTGGVLGPTESCVFTVTVQVPGDASGTFTNVTSVVGADVDGQTAEGDASGVATSILIVEGNPIEIPTLGGWGFLLLAGGLGLLGLGRIRRR